MKLRAALGLSLALGLAVAVMACGDDASSDTSSGTGAAGGGGSGGAGGTAAYASLEQPELERITRFLASDDLNGRDEGSPGGVAARGFIIEELTRCGLEPAGVTGFEQPITNGTGSNLLARVPGTDPTLTARHVLVSAHYDHIGSCGGDICNGANDNAAGVAIALGVACAIAETPTARTLLFASWDAEEPPAFQTDRMGSEFYGANPVVPLEQIDVALVMDLVGSGAWPGYQGHFLLGGELSPEVAGAFAAAPVPEGLLAYQLGLHLAEETPLGHVPWSDHDAFRNRGVPAVLISNGQDKRYHTPEDHADLLDFPKMARQAKYLFDTVTILGNATVTPTFNAAGEQHAVESRNVQTMLQAALAAGGLVDALGLSAQSRTTLEGDLAGVTTVVSKVDGGGAADAADVQTLRDATQHLLCFAGTGYSEATCNQF
jgi:hypothetical protein